MKLSILLLLLLSPLAFAQAPSVKLANGQTFRKVTIEDLEQDKVRLKHDRGETLVNFENIDPAAAKQLGVFEPGGDLGRNSTDPVIRRWIGQAEVMSRVPVRKKDEAAKTFQSRIEDFIKLGDSSLRMMRMDFAKEEEAFAASEKEKRTTPESRQRLKDLRSVMLYCELTRIRCAADAKKAK